MKHANSPFEDLFNDILYNIRNNFKRHDKYLNIGLLLALTPLPFVGFIALIISLLGFYLNYKNKFVYDETSRLVAIFLISIVNISLTFVFAYNFYNLVFSVFYEIISNIKLFFINIFYTKDIFI